MPSRLEMGTTGQQGIDGSRWYLLDQQTETLQGGGVRPMQVFDDQEDRVSFGQFEEHGDESFQRLLALPLGRDVERRVPRLWERQREQRSKEWHHFLQG